MAGMNVFANNAFSMSSLTGAVEKIDYVPQTLGELNIFEPMPVRTRDIFVDKRAGKLTLIQTSAIGAPPDELVKDDRTSIPLRTTRLAKGFTMYAIEVEGIRAHGTESELMQVQTEYLRRMARVRNDMELTHEMHRLGALQGLLLDADGSTVIYDYFAEFGVVAAPVVNFALSTPTTNVRQICVNLVRDMMRNSGGGISGPATIHALVGDSFFDALITHPNVEKTYLNWSAAADLRSIEAFSDFSFGGIMWHNYRGTDNNSTVAVPLTGARFFPVGGNDVFVKAMAPAEFGPYIGTAGQDMYAINIQDMHRQAWTRGELYSYPLYFCQRPECLRTGLMG